MGATLFGATGVPQDQPAEGRRRSENLAYAFQEILTVITRIRGNRQPVTDANKFRTDMKAALKRAERESLSRNYRPEDVRLAVFAVVAFLDESILNSNSSVFADWSRMPLQEEMYGHQFAGETFFQNLESLMARADSQDLGDVLELYLLCMLLGYKGRYGISSPGALRPITEAVGAKLRHIRGPLPGFSPSWAVPPGAMASKGSDPWVRRLIWGAGICLVLAVIFFFSFKLILGAGISSLHALAAPNGR